MAAVRGVRVYVADVNGPRGGVDKTCVVTAALADGRVVTVTEKAERTVPAVRQAASRLGRTVLRLLDRARTVRRQADGGKGVRS